MLDREKAAALPEKCFVYLRRSQDREDRQYNSLEKQDRHTRDIVEKQGLTAINLPPEERSAKLVGRPIFNDMMDRVEAGEVQNIAGWVVSRLSRNPVDGGRIIYALDTGKLKGIYTPNRVFRNTADDKMFLAIEFAMAKKNNDDLSEQVRDSFIEKRNHGEYPGPAPIGYINAILGPKTRNIAPDRIKAPKVIACFEFAATGVHTIDEVWKHAINIGLVSRTGRPISKTTLEEMLKRRLYTGVFKYGGNEWHKGSYKPLISVELFDKVQVAMGWVKPRRRDRPSTTSGRFYPFKGILLCGSCRFNITAYTKPKQLASGKTAEYSFYTCTKKNRRVVCKEPQISSNDLQQEIMLRLTDYELSEKDAEQCKVWVRTYFDSHIKNQTEYKPLWLLEQRKARTALDVLDEKLEQGTITDERYKSRAQKHEETLARTQRLLDSAHTNAEAWLELADETFSRVVNIGRVFEDANDEERRELMKYVGSNWYLADKMVGLVARKPFDSICYANKMKQDADKKRDPSFDESLFWRARPDLNRRSPP